MIYDSYAWKRDLLRRKQLIIRYNTKEQFEKDEEATFNVIEKAVFYSKAIVFVDFSVSEWYNINIKFGQPLNC